MRVEELTAEFGIAGVLDFLETEHGLVEAAISLGGMAGEMYLQGAQMTAWQPAGERPVLFTSPNAVFAPARAIRGGIRSSSRGSAPIGMRQRHRSTASRAPRRGTSTGSRPQGPSR